MRRRLRGNGRGERDKRKIHRDTGTQLGEIRAETTRMDSFVEPFVWDHFKLVGGVCKSDFHYLPGAGTEGTGTKEEIGQLKCFYLYKDRFILCARRNY
jgi:hypothetical protein